MVWCDGDDVGLCVGFDGVRFCCVVVVVVFVGWLCVYDWYGYGGFLCVELVVYVDYVVEDCVVGLDLCCGVELW